MGVSEKKMRPVVYRKGFDAKDESGVYVWRGEKLPAVTKIVEPFRGDFTFAQIAQIRKEVESLSASLETGEVVQKWAWDGNEWAFDPVSPLDLLRDGEHISKAGLRALKVAADRGSTIDDCLGLYAAGADPSEDQIEDWIMEAMFGKGRACSVEDCLPYAKSLLAYLDAERPDYYFGQMTVMGDGYAGKPDYIRHDGKGFVLQSLKTTSDPCKFERAWMAQESLYFHASRALVEGDKPGDPPSQIRMPKLRSVEWLVLDPGGYRVRRASKASMKEWYDQFAMPAVAAYHAFRGMPLPGRAARVENGA